MTAFICTRGNRRQALFALDLEAPDAIVRWQANLPGAIGAVYSAPPFSQQTAQHWRTGAGATDAPVFARLTKTVAASIAACAARGAGSLLIERPDCALRDHVWSEAVREAGWGLPLLKEYTVCYGTPGRTSRRQPNVLLHYGHVPLARDPTGMSGEAMVIRACSGLTLPPGSWLADPCIGIGMASRVAVYFDWNCVGCDISVARLETAAKWLQKQGYSVEKRDD